MQNATNFPYFISITKKMSINSCTNEPGSFGAVLYADQKTNYEAIKEITEETIHQIVKVEQFF